MNPIRHEDIIQAGNPFTEAIAGARQLLEEVNALQQKKKVKIQAELVTIRNANTNTKQGQNQIVSSSNEILKQANEAKVLYDQYGRVLKQLDNMTEAANEFGQAMEKASSSKKQTFDNSTERYLKSLSSVQKQHASETLKRIREEERERKRALQAQIREEKAKQAAMDALQRQRSQELVRSWQEEIREQKRVTAQKIAEARREARETMSARESLNKQRTQAYQSTSSYTRNIKLQKLKDAESDAAPGSYAKISASLARVTYEMKNFHKVGSATYRQLEAQAASYNAQLKKLDAAHGVFGRTVGNYATAIRNAWMGMTAALAGTYYAARRWIMLNAELSDSMAAVRRTTGMTQDEVNSLNKTLERLDTRTSQTSLLDLAHAAGKLGVAKDQVAGFVKAADMIGVALGKDIGNNEEAINQLGRIVSLFKVDAGGLGMEKALLKVGSALKDLGNASVAEETNIIDFTKRLGGIAPIAGMSVDKIMALGATMDILGQTMEVSSTAINQVWLGMAKDSEKFAKIAGIEVGVFKTMMVKDFNEAFIAVAKGLNKFGGGMDELASYFDGLGLDGRRLIGVMSALSNNTDTYRKQIDIANKSLNEGTTVARQFAIQNENLAAKLAKFGKELLNIVRNVGAVKAIETVFDSLNESLRLANTYLTAIAIKLGALPRPKRPIDIVTDPKEIIKKYKELMNMKYKFSGETYFSYTDKRLGAGIEKPELGLAYRNKKMEIFFSEWAAKIEKMRQSNQAAIDELMRMDKLRAMAEAEYREAEDAKRKEAIEDWKRLQEAYYQFLLDLGRKTVDEIVQHERQKLIESGVWEQATIVQQLTWYKQAAIDAEDKINKAKLEPLELYYKERINEAKRNGEDTYAIEREFLEKKMSSYQYDKEKYREYQQELLNLDDEYSDKAMQRWDEYYKELNQLRKDNKLGSIENEITTVELKISKIEEKKVSAGGGSVGQTLTESDIAELEALYKKRNQLIDKYTDAEVGMIKDKIVDLIALKKKMFEMGVLSPEDIAKYEEQIKAFEIEIEKLKLSAESDKKIPSLKLEQGTRPFDKFFEPKQWQNDLQKILGYVQNFTNAVNDMLGSINETYMRNMDAELYVVENRYQREYEAIDKMVANKSISEQQAANKKTALEKRQKLEQERITKNYAQKQQDIAYIQAGINMALSVTNAIATVPFPESLVVAALYLATGAIQLGNIASAKYEEGGYGKVDKKKGGVLKGKRHAQGGIKLNGIGEAEDGEYFAIINRDATKRYKKELPKIFKAINENKLSNYVSSSSIINSNSKNEDIYNDFISRIIYNTTNNSKNKTYNKKFIDNNPHVTNISNDNRSTQLFDKRGVAPQIIVNVKDQYGKDMLREMRRPQTRVYEEGTFTVYETGNYRLKTSRQ